MRIICWFLGHDCESYEEVYGSIYSTSYCFRCSRWVFLSPDEVADMKWQYNKLKEDK